MRNKDKMWVNIRNMVSRVLIFLLIIPIMLWSYLYVLKDEIAGVPHWFRIDIFGQWQEEVGSFFNIVAQGDYLKDGLYPIIIPILVFIGIFISFISLALTSISGGKLTKPSTNFTLIRRISSVFVIIGTTSGLAGIIIFTKFIDSIRSVNLFDYSVTFYMLTIALVVSLLIGLISVIYPGKWNKFSEEIIEDDFDDPWKKLKNNNSELVD